ncbi:ankyrin-1-like [Octopus sinensis]|uniref:Ankyrin-1-like n=1 Tax=Octopus sinensis TaxID=2607531 RepID=A0A6P7TX09_9MOLL|nr:ankyrin-1-like [Octopus sinensis]
MILFLLKNKVSIDMQTNIGYTALHQAAQQGSLEFVHLLLEAGANPDILCYENQTALDIARLFDHPEIVNVLSACTTAETSGPISKESRIVGAPTGIYESIYMESEEETSDAHTLRRLLRFPKYVDNSSNFLNSTYPVGQSFDGVSATIVTTDIIFL